MHPLSFANTEQFLEMISRAIGAKNVDLRQDTRRRYGETTLPSEDQLPLAVVFPSSTTDVQKIVSAANLTGVRLHAVSGGQNTGFSGRSLLFPDQIVVDLGRRMKAILEINEELAYCVVEPGVTFQSLYDELACRESSLMVSPTGGPPQGSLIGNALEKGGGYGAYGDHFSMLCGMEIVLGTGEVIRTGDSCIRAGAPHRWHISKSSFGPGIDGLFTQSNFGIVTQAGMWLMPRPAAIEPFFLTFPNDEDLTKIIELVRPLRLKGVVPTNIRVSSDLYIISTYERHPCHGDRSSNSPLRADERRELHLKYGLGAWNVSGAIYAPDSRSAEAMIQHVKAQFKDSGGRFIHNDEAEEIKPFRPAAAAYHGIPRAGELSSLSWRPGGGALWFAPGIPLHGALASECIALARRICEDHVLDFMVCNVCAPRMMRAVQLIIYNRRDPEERQRADLCYQALAGAFTKRGYSVGRVPSDYYSWHQNQRMPTHAFVSGAIKAACDPNRILAPGLYGLN